MRRALRHAAVLALTLTALALPAGRATACPNCKEAVAAQPADQANMARGYNYSVLFMASMPFVLLSTGALVVARAVKRGVLPEM